MGLLVPAGGTVVSSDARLDQARALLELRGVGQEFHVNLGRRRRGVLSAVSDISFVVREGETLGLVGESGCGKSTVARAIVQAPRPTRGTVRLRDVELSAQHGARLRRARRDVQMVFQDPYSSLDPRWTVADLVAEPLRINDIGSRPQQAARVAELMDLVGLSIREFGPRRPRQLSGGQAQRVGIARALALSPALVICDEAVSSLDVSIQAQVLNLLTRLQQELHVTYLFIAHDLAVVKHVSDRVAVMYMGRLCELGQSEAIYTAPAHPYTASLLAAAAGTKSTDTAGEAPSPLQPPSGCRYRTHCPSAQDRCSEEVPELRHVGIGQQVACHFPLPGITGDRARPVTQGSRKEDERAELHIER